MKQSNLDPQGKLYVGAAIGATGDYLERTSALIKAGTDVLVIDIANGHNDMCIETVTKIKEDFPNSEVVAGSIATGEGALNLIKAGVDGIRCGIGNGMLKNVQLNKRINLHHESCFWLRSSLGTCLIK